MSDLITFSNFHLIQVLIYKFGWFSQSHECLFPEKFKKPSKILTAWGVSKYGVISGPYFPVFRLNMEIYSVNLCIQPEYRKMRTRNNSEFGHISRSRRHSIYASSFWVLPKKALCWCAKIQISGTAWKNFENDLILKSAHKGFLII